MEQYNMRAKFYPAKEPINGYIGNADLFISDVVRLRGIAVFNNVEGPGHHIQFPGFGENGSFVAPHSKEAFAQMLDAVEKAVGNEEKHFGYVAGKKKVDLSVTGKAVDEPYADARFSLQVGDICTVHGIKTQEVSYEKEGNPASFISVEVPNLPPYEKNGEKVYPPILEGLKSSYQKDGQEMHTDFAQVIRALVISERNKVLAKPPLENQMDTAAQKVGQPGAGEKNAPVMEAQR